MSTLTLTPPAYALLTLHAARYPHATVVGLLVGDAASSTVTHVVPVAHHWTSLAPAQDIAVDLAAAHAANASGKGQLLGVYEAPAVASVDEPSAAAVRLAGKVAQAASKAGSSSSSSSGASASHIVVVQGSKLLSGDSADSTTHGLVPYTLPASATASGMARPKKSGDANGSGVTVQGGTKTFEAVKRLVRGPEGVAAGSDAGGAWKGLRDFDDHLEDTAADWLDNASLVQFMTAAGVSA